MHIERRTLVLGMVIFHSSCSPFNGQQFPMTFIYLLVPFLTLLFAHHSLQEHFTFFLSLWAFFPDHVHSFVFFAISFWLSVRFLFSSHRRSISIHAAVYFSCHVACCTSIIVCSTLSLLLLLPLCRFCYTYSSSSSSCSYCSVFVFYFIQLLFLFIFRLCCQQPMY